MKEIPLEDGLVVLVDDEDFERAISIKWRPQLRTHVVYAEGRVNGKNTSLHRVIMNAAPRQLIDHKNRDGLDCRKENLRFATHTQNHANSIKRINTASAFKGVTWDKRNNIWVALITCEKRLYTLGRYADQSEAAMVYDSAARLLFGEFARTNFQSGETMTMNELETACWRAGKRKRSSQFRGVSRRTYSQKWQAGIKVRGVYFHIGVFPDEVEAAKAYDLAAEKMLGAKARLNFKRTA